MSTLSAHRANFTWALNKYNETEDPPTQERFARYMAKYIKAAEVDGFSLDAVSNGQSYPGEEVKKYSDAPALSDTPEMTEEQVNESLAQKVDTASVVRMGAGKEFVYAYGYNCAPDRLKIGMSSQTDCVRRIVQQIDTSTPDRPVLHIEIKTDRSDLLERAMHSILIHRGKKIHGGGEEWFKTTAAEIKDIYEFVAKSE
jgi:T5orf172 domain-containing protein